MNLAVEHQRQVKLLVIVERNVDTKLRAQLPTEQLNLQIGTYVEHENN